MRPNVPQGHAPARAGFAHAAALSAALSAGPHRSDPPFRGSGAWGQQWEFNSWERPRRS